MRMKPPSRVSTDPPSSSFQSIGAPRYVQDQPALAVWLFQFLDHDAHGAAASGAEAAGESLAAHVGEPPALMGGAGPFGVFHHVEPDVGAAFGLGLSLGGFEKLLADAAATRAG